MPEAGASSSPGRLAVIGAPSTAAPLSVIAAFSVGLSATVPAVRLPVSALPWLSVNDTDTASVPPSSVSVGV